MTARLELEAIATQRTQVGYLQAWPKMSTLAGRADAHCCCSAMLPFWDFDGESGRIYSGCVKIPARQPLYEKHARLVAIRSPIAYFDLISMA